MEKPGALYFLGYSDARQNFAALKKYLNAEVRKGQQMGAQLKEIKREAKK